jgi:D-amino-acid oxidase
MKSGEQPITVLGGGILGLTVALGLRISGFRVKLVSKEWADLVYRKGEFRNPRLASLYPAASIIPNWVHLKGIEDEFRFSQDCFLRFLGHAHWGIRRDWHWEIFETPPREPAYWRALHDLERLPACGAGLPGCPRRDEKVPVYGWRFSGVFVEYPKYLSALGQSLEALGVLRETRTVTSQEPGEGTPGPIVNCLGVGGPVIGADSRPSVWMRGYLFKLSPHGLPFDRTSGRGYCYTYHPLPWIYPTGEGTGGGVYFYPRSDSWVLGGSAEVGPVNMDGDWKGESYPVPRLKIDGLEVPEPIFELNRLLIRQLTGKDIARMNRHAVVGYRYVRDLEGEGARLGPDPGDSERVFHAYGFGGGGVTLSWAAARAAIRWIRQFREPDLGAFPNRGLFRVLEKVLTG